MKKRLSIAIVGAGNAGCAHAFKFSQLGHSVTLIKTSHSIHDENFLKVLEQGGIWGIDNTDSNRKSFQKINLATRDVEQGLKDAEVIFILTQSLQHKDIARLIKPHIPESLKMILVIPGNLGSVIFSNVLGASKLIIGEGESTPYDARIIEPGCVNILFQNVRNRLGFISQKEKGMKLAKYIIDTYTEARTNVVESALHNPNLIVHTIGVIMSAARIENTKGEFWMYREAFTDSIWNLIDQLDKEKNEVIMAFDGIPSNYIDECKYRNENDLTKDSLEVFNSYGINGGPKGPSSLYTRYLFEDVPNGLCLLNNLGKIAGIETPICNSLITIASSLVKEDFNKNGRSVEDLNWSSMSLNEIKSALNN